MEAGAPLLRDKNDARIKLVSPVAGTVEAIVRGARRKIERVVVAVDSAASPAQTVKTPIATDAEAVANALMESGLWAMMRRRPYDIIPQLPTSRVQSW